MVKFKKNDIIRYDASDGSQIFIIIIENYSYSYYTVRILKVLKDGYNENYMSRPNELHEISEDIIKYCKLATEVETLLYG